MDRGRPAERSTSYARKRSKTPESHEKTVVVPAVIIEGLLKHLLTEEKITLPAEWMWPCEVESKRGIMYRKTLFEVRNPVYALNVFDHLYPTEPKDVVALMNKFLRTNKKDAWKVYWYAAKTNGYTVDKNVKGNPLKSIELIATLDETDHLIKELQLLGNEVCRKFVFALRGAPVSFNLSRLFELNQKKYDTLEEKLIGGYYTHGTACLMPAQNDTSVKYQYFDFKTKQITDHLLGKKLNFSRMCETVPIDEFIAQMVPTAFQSADYRGIYLSVFDEVKLPYCMGTNYPHDDADQQMLEDVLFHEMRIKIFEIFHHETEDERRKNAAVADHARAVKTSIQPEDGKAKATAFVNQIKSSFKWTSVQTALAEIVRTHHTPEESNRIVTKAMEKYKAEYESNADPNIVRILNTRVDKALEYYEPSFIDTCFDLLDGTTLHFGVAQVEDSIYQLLVATMNEHARNLLRYEALLQGFDPDLVTYVLDEIGFIPIREASEITQTKLMLRVMLPYLIKQDAAVLKDDLPKVFDQYKPTIFCDRFTEQIWNVMVDRQSGHVIREQVAYAVGNVSFKTFPVHALYAANILFLSTPTYGGTRMYNEDVRNVDHFVSARKRAKTTWYENKGIDVDDATSHEEILGEILAELTSIYKKSFALLDICVRANSQFTEVLVPYFGIRPLDWPTRTKMSPTLKHRFQQDANNAWLSAFYECETWRAQKAVLTTTIKLQPTRNSLIVYPCDIYHLIGDGPSFFDKEVFELHKSYRYLCNASLNAKNIFSNIVELYPAPIPYYRQLETPDDFVFLEESPYVPTPDQVVHVRQNEPVNAGVENANQPTQTLPPLVPYIPPMPPELYRQLENDMLHGVDDKQLVHCYLELMKTQTIEQGYVESKISVVAPLACLDSTEGEAYGILRARWKEVTKSVVSESSNPSSNPYYVWPKKFEFQNSSSNHVVDVLNDPALTSVFAVKSTSNELATKIYHLLFLNAVQNMSLKTLKDIPKNVMKKNYLRWIHSDKFYPSVYKNFPPAGAEGSPISVETQEALLSYMTDLVQALTKVHEDEDVPECKPLSPDNLAWLRSLSADRWDEIYSAQIEDSKKNPHCSESQKDDFLRELRLIDAEKQMQKLQTILPEDMRPVFCRMDLIYRIFRRVFCESRSLTFDEASMDDKCNADTEEVDLQTVLSKIKAILSFATVSYRNYADAPEEQSMVEKTVAHDVFRLKREYYSLTHREVGGVFLAQINEFPPSEPYSPLTHADFEQREQWKFKTFQQKLLNANNVQWNKAELINIRTLNELPKAFQFATHLTEVQAQAVESLLNNVYVKSSRAEVVNSQLLASSHEDQDEVGEVDNQLIVLQPRANENDAVAVQEQVTAAETLAEVRAAETALSQLIDKGFSVTDDQRAQVEALAQKRLTALTTLLADSSQVTDLQVTNLLAECQHTGLQSLAASTEWQGLKSHLELFQPLCDRVHELHKRRVEKAREADGQIVTQLANDQEKRQAFVKDVHDLQRATALNQEKLIQENERQQRLLTDQDAKLIELHAKFQHDFETSRQESQEKFDALKASLQATYSEEDKAKQKEIDRLMDVARSDREVAEASQKVLRGELLEMEQRLASTLAANDQSLKMFEQVKAHEFEIEQQRRKLTVAQQAWEIKSSEFTAKIKALNDSAAAQLVQSLEEKRAYDAKAKEVALIVSQVRSEKATATRATKEAKEETTRIKEEMAKIKALAEDRVRKAQTAAEATRKEYAEKIAEAEANAAQKIQEATTAAREQFELQLTQQNQEKSVQAKTRIEAIVAEHAAKMDHLLREKSGAEELARRRIEEAEQSAQERIAASEALVVRANEEKVASEANARRLKDDIKRKEAEYKAAQATQTAANKAEVDQLRKDLADEKKRFEEFQTTLVEKAQRTNEQLQLHLNAQFEHDKKSALEQHAKEIDELRSELAANTVEVASRLQEAAAQKLQETEKRLKQAHAEEVERTKTASLAAKNAEVEEARQQLEVLRAQEQAARTALSSEKDEERRRLEAEHAARLAALTAQQKEQIEAKETEVAAAQARAEASERQLALVEEKSRNDKEALRSALSGDNRLALEAAKRKSDEAVAQAQAEVTRVQEENALALRKNTEEINRLQQQFEAEKTAYESTQQSLNKQSKEETEAEQQRQLSLVTAQTQQQIQEANDRADAEVAAAQAQVIEAQRQLARAQEAAQRESEAAVAQAQAEVARVREETALALTAHTDAIQQNKQKEIDEANEKAAGEVAAAVQARDLALADKTALDAAMNVLREAMAEKEAVANVRALALTKEIKAAQEAQQNAAQTQAQTEVQKIAAEEEQQRLAAIVAEKEQSLVVYKAAEAERIAAAKSELEAKLKHVAETQLATLQSDYAKELERKIAQAAEDAKSDATAQVLAVRASTDALVEAAKQSVVVQNDIVVHELQQNLKATEDKLAQMQRATEKKTADLQQAQLAVASASSTWVAIRAVPLPPPVPTRQQALVPVRKALSDVLATRQTHQNVEHRVVRAAAAQKQMDQEQERIRRLAKEQAQWLAQVVTTNCTPEAVRRLKEAYAVQEAAAKVAHAKQVEREEDAFRVAASTTQTFGGSAFRLVHGSNQAINNAPLDATWMPEARVVLSTGFVQTASCIPVTHAQAFWTYYLLHF